MTADMILKASLLLIPPLVQHARLRKTISYESLGEITGVSPHLQIPRAIAYIRQEICSRRNLPDLTAVAVEKTEDGFDGEIQTISVDPERNRVFLCPDWDRLVHTLGLQPLESSPTILLEEGKAFSRFAAEGNVELMKGQVTQLVEHLAEHPEILGLHTWRAGEIDHLFISGDRCDVLFDRGGLPAIAVVKTRHRGEQVCGIFQLVKLRALLEAEKGYGDPIAVQSWLVSEEIAPGIQAYAGIYKIQCASILRH